MTHIHRWRIAEPDGRKLLPATCECGATKEVYAGFPDYDRLKTSKRTFKDREAMRGAS